MVTHIRVQKQNISLSSQCEFVQITLFLMERPLYEYSNCRACYITILYTIISVVSDYRAKVFKGESIATFGQIQIFSSARDYHVPVSHHHKVGIDQYIFKSETDS